MQNIIVVYHIALYGNYIVWYRVTIYHPLLCINVQCCLVLRLLPAVGEGRECQNITVESTFLGTGDSHVEVFCLVDGEHHYNHTIDEEHSVEVVGYTESDIRRGFLGLQVLQLRERRILAAEAEGR